MSVSKSNSYDAYICPNCQAQAIGLACSTCGQQRIAEEELSFKHALRSLFNETFKLDSRLFLTLKTLVTKPGQLTVDFLEGRRGKQIHPLKLYLTVVPLFYILIQHSIFTLPQLIKYEAKHPLAATIERRANQAGQSPEEFLKKRDSSFQRSFKALGIASNFIVFAPLLWILFRERLKYLGHHLVMVFHFATFSALLGCVVHLLLMQHVKGVILGIALNIGNFVYLLLSAHRVYHEDWPKTISKCLAFIVIDQIVVGLGLAVAVLFALFG